jgi:hypothetical protein
LSIAEKKVLEASTIIKLIDPEVLETKIILEIH